VGYTGAELSNYTVYYRANSTGSYSSSSLGTSATGTITGLQPNTTYQFYVKATNAAGNVDSSTTTAKTKAYAPVVSVPTASGITSSGGSISVSATGDTNASITNYTLY
jgi:plastocyanin domain-containing protein